MKPQTAFHVYSVVEGDGDRAAVPKLLHRLWPTVSGSSTPRMLRTDKDPHVIPRHKFIQKPGARSKKLRDIRDLVNSQKDNCGVVFLLDADKDCPKEFWQKEKGKAIRADIVSTLEGIPCLFVFAEKGYESWLVDGMGGNGLEGSPKSWLRKNRKVWDERCCYHDYQPPYKSTIDQAPATSSKKFNPDLAAEKNASFRRLWDWLLKMAEGG